MKTEGTEMLKSRRRKGQSSEGESKDMRDRQMTMCWGSALGELCVRQVFLMRDTVEDAYVTGRA